MSWLITGLSISFALNCLLVWYIVQLLKRYLIFQDRIDDFADNIEEYEKHVNTVYNLETFYGDETLRDLLGHSKTMVESCNDFRLLYLMNEEDAQEMYDEEEEIDAP
tara:strand:- start:35641 stop:35961 length:321 start_codon:yes stop_codon:yes gene_type:complete